MLQVQSTTAADLKVETETKNSLATKTFSVRHFDSSLLCVQVNMTFSTKEHDKFHWRKISPNTTEKETTISERVVRTVQPCTTGRLQSVAKVRDNFCEKDISNRQENVLNRINRTGSTKPDNRITGQDQPTGSDQPDHTGPTGQNQPNLINRTGSTRPDQPDMTNQTGSTTPDQPHRLDQPNRINRTVLQIFHECLKLRRLRRCQIW